jgi:hypothetical protein
MRNAATMALAVSQPATAARRSTKGLRLTLPADAAGVLDGLL